MTEQMKRLEAVKKRCSTLAKVVGIFEVICIVLTIITLTTSLTFLIGQDKLNPELQKGIDQGYINYETSINIGGAMGVENLIPANDNYALGIGLTCLFATLAIFFVVVILAFIKKIFTIIKEENSPFSDKCLKNIKIGFIVITIFSPP